MLIIIGDIVLPRLDGYGLCHAVKGRSALQHFAVLLISGEDGEPSTHVSPDGFFFKPFNGDQLQLALERVMRRCDDRLPGSDGIQ